MNLQERYGSLPPVTSRPQLTCPHPHPSVPRPSSLTGQTRQVDCPAASYMHARGSLIGNPQPNRPRKQPGTRKGAPVRTDARTERSPKNEVGAASKRESYLISRPGCCPYCAVLWKTTRTVSSSLPHTLQRASVAALFDRRTTHTHAFVIRFELMKRSRM